MARNKAFRDHTVLRTGLRYLIPMSAENIGIIGVGLISSAFFSKISDSALTAVGISTTIVTLLTAIFGILTTGSTVLTARAFGAGEKREASAITGQTLMLTLSAGIAVTIIMLFGSGFFIRLLMPSAEDALYKETVNYFRIVVLSFPFMIAVTVLSNIMRSSGNFVAPMAVSLALNILQLVTAWLLTVYLHMGITGAGLSYVIARFAGAAAILFIVMRASPDFEVNIRDILVLNRGIIRRILRIGLPTTIESVVVQGGYLLANAMAVGLGLTIAAVYQVTATVYTYFALPQGIGSMTAMVMVGRYIGAGEKALAKKATRSIWLACIAATLLICIPATLAGTSVTELYTDSPSVAEASASILWLITVMCIPATSINVIDPVLRSGGDTVFPMISSIMGTWLIRVPLTYLFCYHWQYGVFGIYLANLTGLSLRALLGIIRYKRGHWMRSV